MIYIFINRFLQQIIVTLESFETIIRKISNAKYPTLSFVVLYIYILKNHFAPNEEENESLDTYLSLVYGSNGEEEDSEIVSDDEYIPSGGTRQHWQYSHRQLNYSRRGNTRNRGHSRGRGRRRGRTSTSHPVEPNLDDINIVEYLQPVNTNSLLQKVHAAIYLSLDEF